MRARRGFRVLVAVTVLAVATAGLGGTVLAASRPKALPTAVWARATCGAVSSWSADVQARLAAAERALPAESSSAEARDAMVALLGALADRTDELVVVLQTAGAPAAAGGKPAANAVQRAYASVEDGLRGAQSVMRDAAPDDPDTFAATLGEVTGRVESALADATVKFPSSGKGAAALGRALAAQKVCRDVVEG